MSGRRCPECQSPLEAGALDGLCPRCLAGLLFDVGPAPEAAGVDGVSAPVTPPPMTTQGVLLEVPGYEVTKELARGGMGIVYRATQLEPRREVALKMLLPHQLESEEFRERFLLEARAIARLEHPHILPVYQVGEHDGVPFFTMKLAAGGTLAERRTRYRRSWRETAQLVATLAEAVQYAHERGVLHRDLKPGNVLFDDAGRPYVSDFGLAKLNDDEAMPEEEPGQVVGTPRYVAPEVAGHGSEQATVAADIYGLGVILYELLAQKPPFNALSQVALLRMVEHAPPPPPSHEMRGVPYDLDVIALRCLEKSPSRRFTTAGALAQELRRWLAGEPIESIPATRREQFWRWVREQRLVVGLTAALAVLGLVMVVGSVWVALRLAGSRKAVVEERDRARNDLVQARLGEARGLRLSGAIRVRDRSLDLLAAAARVDPRTELRDEAAAILGRWEFGPEEARHRLTAAGMPADLSPSFELVADGSPSGEVRVWRRATGHVVWSRTPAAGKAPQALEFSPGARWLAALVEPGVVVLDAATGREVWRGQGRWAGFAGDDVEFGVVTAPGRLECRDAASGGVRVLALPADALGGVFLSGSPGRPDCLVQLPDRVEVLDGVDGHRRHLLPFTRGTIRSAAWRDNLLVAGDSTGGIRVWNLRSGQTRDLTGHRGPVTRLVFSPDASLLLSASADGVSRIWHARSGSQLGMSELWQPVRFNAESTRIAYTDGSALGIAPLLPPVGLSMVPLRGVGNTAVRQVEFSPDSRWLVAVQSCGIHLLDSLGNVQVHEPLAGVVAAHFSADARRLLVVQRTGVQSYEINEDARHVRLVPGRRLPAAAGEWLGPAGHLDAAGLVAVARGSGRVGLLDSSALSWSDLAEGQANTTALDTDPERRWAAVESGSLGSRVFRVRGELAWQDATGAGAPVFSPDGRYLLLAGGELHRAVSAGEWRTRLALETGGGNTTPGVGCWSLYGRAFALAGPRSGVVVVSTESWQPLVRLQPLLPVTCLAFGPHGRLLAAGTDDDHLVIWSLPDLRDALAMHGPLDWRESISPQGHPAPPPVPLLQAIPESLRQDRPLPAEVLPRAPQAPPTVVDLTGVMNRPLEPRDGLPSGLRELPAGFPLGLVAFGDVPFDVRGMVQLSARGGSLLERRWPSRVRLPLPARGIRRFHLLASTRGGADLPNGTVVAQVRCEWAGGVVTETPLRLGWELGDGWHRPEAPRRDDRSVLAWEGISEASEAVRSVVRVYRMAIDAPAGGATPVLCELVGDHSAASAQVFGVTVEP